MNPRLLDVALPLPVPQTFSYLAHAAPEPHAGWHGCRVRVPLGPRNLIGIVVGERAAPASQEGLRWIEQRVDRSPLLEGELLGTLRWAAGYYQRALGDVLATALPVALRQGKPLPETRLPLLCAQDAPAAAALRPGALPARLYQWLQQQGTQSEPELDAALPGWRAAARSLQQRGLLLREWKQASVSRPGTPGPAPNAEQRTAIDAVVAALGTFAPILLEGVTGSGKTEIYLAAIEQCLARGEQALVLVPEIGLTPQTQRRFAARLPVPVLTLHSGLSEGERARAWTAMWRGEGRVLLGTRSAIFAPLPRPGLIVVDEEHDSSYKQQDGFRYNARDLALVRGKALGVPVLLGSATPALETLQQAQAGRYRRLRLSHRPGAARAPTVDVLDIRREPLRHGLSAPLLEAVADCLQRGEQAMVFRNRRGFAPSLLCHDCGWHAGCPRCDAALTLHARGSLICHHCGHRERPPSACPSCGGLALVPQGAGTERLEQALAERFPDIPLIRVDRETTQHRNAVEQHFARLGDAPGILVGTQMLAKGHDLPRLTLVAIASVDDGLFSADFRAGERLAQLLIQVSGRAGRAERPGHVLVQTHHPGHPLLKTLLSGGYRAWAEQALLERRDAEFPPFAHLALLRAEALGEVELESFLEQAWMTAHSAAPEVEACQCHRPLPAPMARRAGRTRGQMLLSSARRPALQALLTRLLPMWAELKSARRVRWSIDVDPVDLF